MSKQRFPLPADQPGAVLQEARVTGASVSAVTAGSAGLDGRGKNLCTILKGTAGTANRVTITWLVSYADTPYVVFGFLTANCAINIVSQSASQLVVDTVTRDSNGTGINDANFSFLVLGFSTVSYMS